MKIRIKLFLVTFLLIFNIYSSLSQNEDGIEQPLKIVLEAIEIRHNVSFSYADYVIKNKLISLPKNDLTLKEVIGILKNKTKLDFKFLNDNVIVIKKKNKKKVKKTIEFEPLDEVLVKGYLTSGISKKNDGTINLKTDKLGILPGLIEPDVLQIINSFPGIITTDESISNINVRGGTHDQNLILFDGIRMYKSGHFFGLISAFNPHLDYDISLSKSGSSAKYGEGISSVIDIKLPNEITNKSKISLGFNLINLDFLAKMPLTPKTELQFAVRRSITDFIKTPTYDRYFERAFQDSDLNAFLNNNSIIIKDENFKFYDVYSKFIWDISKKDKLKLIFLNIDNDLTYKEELTNSIRNQESESKLNQQSFTTGLTYERKWNDQFKIDIQKYFTVYNLSSKNADIINQQNLIQENKVEDNGIKLNSNYTFNSKLSLLSGYQFSQIAIGNLEDLDKPSFRRYIKQVLLSHAVYTQFNYLTDQIELKAGLRINYFDKFNRYLFEPRFTFNYKFLNNFNVLVTGEVKSQTVSQVIDLQEDFLGIEKRRWILANDNDIPISNSKQISLGLFYKKNNFLISTEVYKKDVNNINARSQGFQNQFQFIKDIGNYSVIGFDFLINQRFNNINAWLSYSYSSNNYSFLNLNNAEIFPNNVDIRSVINLAANYTHHNFKFALGLNWFTGKPFTEPINSDETIIQNIDFNAPNSSRLTDYIRFDSSINYTFKIGKYTAISGVSIWSILDKRNVLNTYYDLVNSNINKVENTSLRVTPNVSFRINF